ncbi:MAG: DUF4238 domain-containing protein [Bryobacteraceae bacterium]
MHAVPVGYLAAFDAKASGRRYPAVWRFDRVTSVARLVGIKDAEVVNDIYTVVGDNGARDTFIEEEILQNVDGAFCAARDALVARRPLEEGQWYDLAWFIAFQLERTPMMFRMLREELSEHGMPADVDTPQKVMVLTVRRLLRWLHRMDWLLCYNESDFPLLTSDNPATMWRDRGHGVETGVGFLAPDLRITCPLAPTLTLMVTHTEASLKAVRTEPIDADPPPGQFKLRIRGGPYATEGIRRLNLVTITNADRCVYASYNDPQLKRFLEGRFFGTLGPVRRPLPPVEQD